MAAGVAVVLLLACGIGGFVWYQRSGGGDPADLNGMVDYRQDNPAMLSRDHEEGPVFYPISPPVGGVHHSRWQNCMGDVYPFPIEDGHAVHSLEHGAVWITHRPDLPQSEVERLATRVQGQPFMLMSPHPEQDSPISLQAWGYQLAVEEADDERIDEFVRRFRETASMEPGAPCSGGVTTVR
ncbi:DUF3105 domain-containing protein [Plantactinospora sp. CA-290183]|uniref:DUF3105 domain-containing protein n=1 Tax=Plantactinospora sp. CA-290183 TaxID=3240006 RepID=UPI003D9313D7